ncbi:MAG: hypothetical protein Q9217_004468 [Psora testacea]
MDNLWQRRSNSTKLSLSNNNNNNNNNNGSKEDSKNGGSRAYQVAKRFDSFNNKANPLNGITPLATNSVASPASGASSAFGLGSGAFASFGSSAKTPKTPGTTLDFGNSAPAIGDKREKDHERETSAGDVKPKGSASSLASKSSSTTSEHSLKSTWIVWYRPPTSKYSDYEKSTIPLAHFSTAETFWAVYTHLKRPSTLPAVSDYHIFKKGIRPVWEDEENKKGGKWIVRLKKGVSDRYWEDLLLAIIGDQFAEAGEEVCGAVLSVRSGEDVLSVWTRIDGGRNIKIRETIKRLLAFPPDTAMVWKSHDDSIAQRSAIDQARHEKGGGNGQHHGHNRRRDTINEDSATEKIKDSETAMNTRKRRHSTATELQQTFSKRARLLSELWSSLEETDSTSRSSRPSAESSLSIVYKIRGIIGERENEYLIDWTDDPITGESFQPDWQPKANANSAAVEAWKSRQLIEETTLGRHSPKASKKPRRYSTASVASRSQRKAISQPGAEPDSIGSVSSIFLEGPISSRYPGSLLNSPDSTTIPNQIVGVSQHSNLDRDLYVVQQSSPSSQETTTSVIEDSTSLLESRSASLQSASRELGATKDIVPDSQSLLDSSSYVPTTTVNDSVSHSVIRYTSVDAISLGSSSKIRAQDSTQRSSGCIVIANQDSRRSWRRSRSAPASTIPNSTASSLSTRTPPSFPRSVSDPGHYYHSPQGGRLSSQIEVPGSTKRLSNTSSTSVLNVVGTAEYSRSDQSFLKPVVPASETFSLGDGSCQRSRHSSTAPPEAFVVAEDNSLDHPSQATTTDDSVLNDRDLNFQLLRQSLSSPQRSQLSYPPSIEIQDSQTPPVPPSTSDSRELSQPRSEADGLMANTPMATPDLVDGSRDAPDTPAMSARERVRRRKALTEATLEQQRAERRHISSVSPESPLAPRSPSHHISEAQSPSGSENPAVLVKQGPRASDTVQDQSYRRAEPAMRSPIATQSPTQQTRVSAPPLSPSIKSPLQHVQSPDTTYSRPSMSPSVRLPYQVQEEPSRLEAEPLEIDTQPEVPLPVRTTQSVPHTPITPSKLSLHKEVSLSPNEHTLEICNLKRGEYVVPLSMPPRIQQQYRATIRYHAPTIKKFMEEKPCKRDTVEETNILLDEVSKVTTHIDLQGSGPPSQADVNPKHEAEYAESCSEKFVFLGCLLEQAIRDDCFSLAVVARPGPLQDILETYLRAKEIPYIRPKAYSKDEPSYERRPLKVTLLASGDKDTAEWTSVANLIIAFDETFKEDDFIFKDRQDDLHAGKKFLPLIVRLVVYASLEHIELCLPRTLNPIERLRRLVFPLVQTQKRVGALGFEETETSSCAGKVFSFVQKSLFPDDGDPWPLPPVRPIEGISLMESDSGLSDARSDISEEYRPQGPIRYWPNPVPPKLIPVVEQNGKRAFVSDAGTFEIDQALTVSPQDLEWGDSLETQAKKQKMAKHYNAGNIEVVSQETPENLRKWLEKAKRRIAIIEAELKKKTDLANDLQLWAGIRQHDYEKLRKEHGDLQVSLAENAEMLAERTASIESLNAQIATLGANYTNLQREASNFQNQLQKSPDPAIAAAASETVQLGMLETENAALKKRIVSLTTDFEFTRQQYQQASRAAVESSAETQSLKPELESLRRKNEANVAEYRKRRDEDVNKEIRKEVQRLKQTVKQRDAFIHKLEGENVELKRGRAGVQTRGSSVQPKSPHGGSRGVSPAAVMLGPQGQMMGHAMARGGSGRGSRLNA